MKKMILITGGARSGKSSLAEKLAKKIGVSIAYIATSVPIDEGMKDRIRKHREARPKEWLTIERYRDFQVISQDIINKYDTILLDCMTLMVSNLLLDANLDYDKCPLKEIDKIEEDIFAEINSLLEIMKDKNLIIVTNEVGMGLVPSYRLGSIFRDIAGRVNQFLASRADEVYFTVSGIPMKIK